MHLLSLMPCASLVVSPGNTVVCLCFLELQCVELSRSPYCYRDRKACRPVFNILVHAEELRD